MAAFPKYNKLVRHMKCLHENIRPYKCTEPNCVEAFKRKDHLDRHKASKHATQIDRTKFKCPYFGGQEGCLMTFPNRDQLRKHVRRKHEQRIECEKCKEMAKLKPGQNFEI